MKILYAFSCFDASETRPVTCVTTRWFPFSEELAHSCCQEGDGLRRQLFLWEQPTSRNTDSTKILGAREQRPTVETTTLYKQSGSGL